MEDRIGRVQGRQRVSAKRDPPPRRPGAVAPERRMRKTWRARHPSARLESAIAIAVAPARLRHHEEVHYECDHSMFWWRSLD